MPDKPHSKCQSELAEGAETSVSSPELAAAISALGTEQFSAQLLALTRSIAVSNSSVLMVYGLDSKPNVLHQELAPEYLQEFQDRYLTGAFLLSPLYQAYRRGESGFFYLREVAPDGFFDGDYYRQYYSYSGLADQVFLLKCFAPGYGVVASIARTHELPTYSPDEINRFKQAEPVLMALMSQQWSTLNQDQPNFSDYLQQASANFGRSKLSAREKTVVDYMLQGHSSKSTARLMDISPETERSYRKTIYRKLEVNSHAELYNLFFAALEKAEPGIEQDPLLYLNDAGSTQLKP